MQIERTENVNEDMQVKAATRKCECMKALHQVLIEYGSDG